MIYRKRKYEYQLQEAHAFKSKIIGYSFSTLFFSVYPDGTWIVNALYAYDGGSGPSIDDPDIKVSELKERKSRTAVPTLHHDVKYQAIRLGLIKPEEKDIADDELHDDLVERGFNPLRADLWHLGVHFGGGSSCEPGTDNDDIMEAF